MSNVERTWIVAGERLTPGQAWDGWVGDQSPQEFVREFTGRAAGVVDPDEMATDYAATVNDTFDVSLTAEDLANLAEALAAAIRITMEREEGAS